MTQRLGPCQIPLKLLSVPIFSYDNTLTSRTERSFTSYFITHSHMALSRDDQSFLTSPVRDRDL